MENLEVSVIQDAIRRIMSSATLSNALLEKCAALSSKYSLSANQIAQYLEAFLINRGDNNLTLQNFGAFESEIQRDRSKNQVQQRHVPVMSTTKVSAKRPIDMLSPPGENPGRRESATAFASPAPMTQSQSDKNKAGGTSASPNSVQGMGSISRELQSTVLYSERNNRGEKVLELNSSLGSRAEFIPSTRAPLGSRCKVSYDDEHFNNVTQRYRYMFTSLDERARALDRQLLNVQETMCKVGNITELQAVGLASQDMIWVCGRICSDSADGKLDKSSIILEGSRKDSGGRRVQLDLVELKGFSLFPGQIVLVEGVNSSGRRMVARRIVEGFQNPLFRSPISQLKEYHHSDRYLFGNALNVVVAAGPFTTSDNLEYQPLRDLLLLVAKRKPDVLVLIGPFVDISQPLLNGDNDVELMDTDEDDNVCGSHASTYEMVFVEKIIRDGLQLLFNSEDDFGTIPTQIIMVPSLQDGHHECVFPQPPFGNRDEVKTGFFEEPLGVLNVPCSEKGDPKRRVHLLPNPCMFRLNEVVVAVTNNDALSSLSSTEINHGITPRLPRLAAHVLQQQSFAPVFPPTADSLSQLDLRQAKHWHMNMSPDILLLPSKQPLLARELFGTVVVNPGSLAVGTSGGTFADISIHPVSADTLQSAQDKLLAAAEKGENVDMTVLHEVAPRTCVNVVRI